MKIVKEIHYCDLCNKELNKSYRPPVAENYLEDKVIIKVDFKLDGWIGEPTTGWLEVCDDCLEEIGMRPTGSIYPNIKEKLMSNYPKHKTSKFKILLEKIKSKIKMGM